GGAASWSCALERSRSPPPRTRGRSLTRTVWLSTLRAMRASLVALPALLLLTASAESRAGIRPFIWTWDAQTVPQGDVELEQWIWARGRMPAVPDTPAAYWLWWGPVLGLSDNLELAVPFQVVANASTTSLESIEVDARYRLFPRNDDGPLQPLIRAA